MFLCARRFPRLDGARNRAKARPGHLSRGTGTPRRITSGPLVFRGGHTPAISCGSSLPGRPVPPAGAWRARREHRLTDPRANRRPAPIRGAHGGPAGRTRERPGTMRDRNGNDHRKGIHMNLGPIVRVLTDVPATLPVEREPATTPIPVDPTPRKE